MKPEGVVVLKSDVKVGYVKVVAGSKFRRKDEVLFSKGGKW